MQIDDLESLVEKKEEDLEQAEAKRQQAEEEKLAKEQALLAPASSPGGRLAEEKMAASGGRGTTGSEMQKIYALNAKRPSRRTMPSST